VKKAEPNRHKKAFLEPASLSEDSTANTTNSPPKRLYERVNKAALRTTWTLLSKHFGMNRKESPGMEANRRTKLGLSCVHKCGNLRTEQRGIGGNLMALGFMKDAICLSGLTGSKLKCDVIGEYYPFWWSITSGGQRANYGYPTAIVELDAATGEVYIEDTDSISRTLSEEDGVPLISA